MVRITLLALTCTTGRTDAWSCSALLFSYLSTLLINTALYFMEKIHPHHPTRTRFILAGTCFCLITALFSSCTSSRRLAYFQAVPSAPVSQSLTARPSSTIRLGDVLSIQVSSLNPEASALFNPYALAAGATNQIAASGANPLPVANGYLVDSTGHVYLPLIGQVPLAGTSTTQAGVRIRERLMPYLKEPTVNVRNLTFRISVMGEVNRPSLFTLPNEQITILEALSLAGDLTIYARRDNVLIIREAHGQRQFIQVDLTKRELFRSPCYYLQANDVVYVEPGKARLASVDQTYQLLPIALSALSFLAIIVRRY